MITQIYKTKSPFNKRKVIALVFLTIWAVDMCLPLSAYALTSGPVTPEAQGFQPAGVSDMVDLKSGDFKYNIPVLDIDGYPVNLSYQSGAGMDDEASWVGFGWSLNTGAINRQIRGVADDMQGDMAVVEHYTKPMVTVGGRLNLKMEAFGIGPFKLSSGLTYGVYNNNYTGYGAELSPNAGMSLSKLTGGYLTGSLGLGVSSDSQKGLDVSPYAALDIRENTEEKRMNRGGLSTSLGYNSRSGMKSLTLGAGFSTGRFQTVSLGNKGSSFSYNTEPINPKISIPYQSRSDSYSFDAGLPVFGIFNGAGITGYRTKRSVVAEKFKRPTYGFLYAEIGKRNPDAVMDFIRENDNPVIPELPNLAIPIHTPDMFSYTSQTGSGQFRLYRGGSGIFFDNFVNDQNESKSTGVDIGATPGDIHVGVTAFDQEIRNYTRKWVKDNNYLSNGDFQDQALTDFNKEHVFFKQMGDLAVQDAALDASMKGTTPVMVQLDANNKAMPNFVGAASQKIERTKRQAKKTLISYLTAEEASTVGLYTKINNYELLDKNSLPTLLPAKPLLKYAYARVDPNKTGLAASAAANYVNINNNDVYPVRKRTHISEINVTDQGGKRMVYGLPVYNIVHNELTFALGTGYSAESQTNHTNFPGRNKGSDHYYHKESKPPYATSYLLTAILSPDYVDRTGDGITTDDIGTAINFNYSKMPYNYNWRTPQKGATINKGLLADPDDDKGSIIYGERELWYINSIETKTKIAYFITENRLDGLGSISEMNGGNDPAKRQRRLSEIRLYSKADMTKPIKVVKFAYDYSSFGSVPNYQPINAGTDPATGGKLTLKRIWFEYQNIDRGKFHYYSFDYNAGASYREMSTDRWGMYKNASENPNAAFGNEEFPYSNQNADRTTVNQNAGMWQMNKIGLPTGGEINVNYEADDYAYVQNRRAMAMYRVAGLYKTGSGGQPELLDAQADGALFDTRAIRIDLPESKMPAPGEANLTNWFKRNLLNGSEYMYTKLSVRMITKNNPGDANQPNDYVPCYAKVSSVSRPASGNYLLIYPEVFTGDGISTNVIMRTALQKLKNDYPRYAYPGYLNRPEDTGSSSIASIIAATITSIGNFGEFFRNFYQASQSNSFATRVDLSKSMVRLAKYDGYALPNGTEVISKVGGGSRVSSIYIKDNWQPNTTNTNETIAAYGQVYSYTTLEGNKIISSGVASYEPSIGNDENPFKMGVPYMQVIKGGIDNYLDIEEPFGESLFPAASVTYGKVTVRDLIKTGADQYGVDPGNRSGYIVNEFYTTKDFPVRTTVLPISTTRSKPKHFFNVLKTVSDDRLYMSQGYSIELNDMDGRPKAERTFNQSGAQISATEYFYKSTDTGGGSYRLDNTVSVVNPDGSVSQNTMGQEIELFGDFREQESINKGRTLNIGSETLFLFLFPVVLPHLPIQLNDDYRLFRSACMMKVVHRYGVLDKVVKTQNGSSISTDNIAFDGVTGDALITRTQNEFKKPIYSLTIPAYWAYKGMAGGYQSTGIMLQNLTTDNLGVVSNYNAYFNSGDEIIDVDQDKYSTPQFGQQYWVVEQVREGQPNKKYLMDRWGVIKKSFTSNLVKIIRSGNRNIFDANILQIVSLNNPVGGNNMLPLSSIADLTTSLKVINASATTYDDSWPSVIPDPKVLPSSGPYDFKIYGASSPTGAVRDIIIDGADMTSTAKNIFRQRVAMNAIRDNLSNPIYSQTEAKPSNSGVMGIIATFYVPETRNYLLGLGGYCDIWVNTAVLCPPRSNWLKTYIRQPQNDIRDYRIYSVPLTKGINKLHIELAFQNGSPYNTRTFDAATVEIYDNSVFELSNLASESNLKPIFSTGRLINGAAERVQVYARPTSYSQNPEYYQSYYDDPNKTPYEACQLPITSVNPFIFGYAGNWKQQKSKVFQQNRVYNGLTNPANAMVDVKNAGYIKDFFSNWYYNSTAGIQKWMENALATRWTTSNTVTIYDQFGQQLENKDALGRFSAAKFDFRGELPGAVASNARYRELYVNSFEDSRFLQFLDSYLDRNPPNEFYNTASGIGSLIYSYSDLYAHTGRYSLLLPQSGITMNTKQYAAKDAKTFPYFAFNSNNEFIKHPDAVYPRGFEPMAKEYMVSVWVHDDKPFDRSYKGITMTMGGSPISFDVKASIEGWKLLEGYYTIPALLNEVELVIKPANNSSGVYIDDLRMHPRDAQVKSYAYNDQTLRLMAELDENAFATFYEYDNQGLLIRVKKETEKGIVTVKETRSSYVKKTL